MKKLVFSLVFTIFSFLITSTPVFAQNCALKTQYYGKCSVSNDNNTDLNLTTCGVGMGTANIASLAVGGSSPWCSGACSMALMDQIAQDNTPAGETIMNCPPAPVTCECGNSLVRVGLDTTFEQYAMSQESGSLLGIANVLHGVSLTEPVPVNLAYYWNDQIKNVPFVNKALAQDVSYSGPFLRPILDIWRTFRNIAYGILSVVMVVVGIMIINRKKISAQAVVNVQMALPRIVLALIFITFSYPIGATIASLAWAGGFSVADVIVYPGPSSSYLNVSGILEIISGFMLALLGPQMVTVFIGIACLIATLIFVIIGEIKILLLYLKMVFSIIFAPVTFALSAIPSADDNVFKWIKTMAMNGISIIAIRFMQQVTVMFAVGVIVSVVQEAATNPGAALGQAFGSAILATFAVPVIMVYGYYLSTKMPSYVENWFSGGDKKQRR